MVKQFASLKRRTTKHVLNAKEVRDDNLDSTILLSETPGLMQADDDERIQDITQQEMVPLLNLQTASKVRFKMILKMISRARSGDRECTHSSRQKISS